MSERTVQQALGGQTLSHVLVPASAERRGAGVVLFPTVMGVSRLELRFARDLAALGYDAMVADFYGRRYEPEERPQAKAAMDALKADRSGLRERVVAIAGAAAEAMELPEGRLAATGYCFGGMCALDLARSGMGAAGVASFHGLLDPPDLEPQPIKARVIAFHGWDDPLAPPNMLVAFGKEMSEAAADWQVHAYGHTSHGFTNPHAAAAGMKGIAYSEAAARRSWASLQLFLDELFC